MSKHRPRVASVLIFFCLGIFALSSAFAAQESAAAAEQKANKAAKIAVSEAGPSRQVAAQTAPAGKTYFVLQTVWTNIHPKQRIEKSKLEGKQDKTMGVGGLLGGTKSEKKEEMVDADVAYEVPAFFDHVYLLADGQSYSLDKLTETVPGGVALKKSFTLPKQGDTKSARFVFLVPEDAKNLAFQFFDYSYGHVLIPLKGELKLAVGGGMGGTGGSAAGGLGRIKDNYLELAATAIDFRADYGETEVSQGWRCAVVKLNGKSLSQGNIVQIEPTEYVWLATKNGQIYYSCGGSTTDEGFIRFTPEFFQSQEVAFVVPASEREFNLGFRVQNRVYALSLGAPAASAPAETPAAVHKDGGTLEVMLFGARREKGLVILDLGIRSLVASGLEIQADAQFILKAGGEDVSYDEESTAALFHRPPTPFTVPPQLFVRFELAYDTAEVPERLHYRGFRSEGDLAVPKLK